MQTEVVTKKSKRPQSTQARAKKLAGQFKQERKDTGKARQAANNIRRWSALSVAERHDVAHRIAQKLDAADRSDPFIYGRVYTHLTNNVTNPSDYGEDF